MTEFDENRMTDLMEHVGRKLVGEEEWAQATMDQRRILKQNVLDITLAVDEFREGETFKPKRDDAVAEWLKRSRDAAPEYLRDTIDMMLDDYRDHADTGTPLSMDVEWPTAPGENS